MQWIINFLTSSIGRKLIMSLTGLFLVIFLVIHLIGNLQLLNDDGGESFNVYAAFMTTNPLIKVTSIGLYIFIVMHAILGLVLWYKNKRARKEDYKVKNYPGTSWTSRYMALLGTMILAFLLLHMGDFWYKMKFTDELQMVTYASHDGEVKDLYLQVSTSFSNLWIVIAYMVGLLVLSFHLWHGFESAFKTLGINHAKYTPILRFLGRVYAIVIPVLFAIIPLLHYLSR